MFFYEFGEISKNTFFYKTPLVAASVCSLPNFRSSRPEVFLRKGGLKICCKFTGDQPCRGVISEKLPRNFIEITLQHGYSPVNLLNIFRTPFPKNTSGGVLLYITKDDFDDVRVTLLQVNVEKKYKLSLLFVVVVLELPSFNVLKLFLFYQFQSHCFI